VDCRCLSNVLTGGDASGGASGGAFIDCSYLLMWWSWKLLNFTILVAAAASEPTNSASQLKRGITTTKQFLFSESERLIFGASAAYVISRVLHHSKINWISKCSLSVQFKLFRFVPVFSFI
jgi:hypothetical protein